MILPAMRGTRGAGLSIERVRKPVAGAQRDGERAVQQPGATHNQITELASMKDLISARTLIESLVRRT